MKKNEKVKLMAFDFWDFKWKMLQERKKHQRDGEFYLLETFCLFSIKCRDQ